MQTKIYELVGSLGDGGAETLVKDYALKLDKEKFDVTVVVWNDPRESANVKRLRENQIRILPVYHKLSYFERVIRKIFGKRYTAYRLGRLVDKEKPDIIHVHLQNLQTLSYISKKLTSIKLFYTCHSLPENMIGRPGTSEFEAARLLIDLNKLQMIALHEAMADEINTMFEIDNTAILNNGIDVARFENVDKTKLEIREQIGIPQNAFVLGHIGRFSYAKNHEFLLEFFEKIHKKNSNAFLLLVGAGELKEHVTENIKNRGLEQSVLILSNRKDTECLYKAMDVFAFPSRYEGFPVSIIEAQAAGLRCFISDRVPKETCATDLVSYLSLDSTDIWVEAIENGAEIYHSARTLEQYDMKEIIKQLQNMYMMENDK